MKLICGIDEAGRGPVLGPMVIAGVAMREKDLPRLLSIGVRDSKLCTPKMREELYDTIMGFADSYKIEIIGPKAIDAAIADPAMNLNILEIVHQVVIIDSIDPDKVIIDCPCTNTESYASRIRTRITNRHTVITAENKADLNHPIVSAASILAKVTRDREVAKIRERLGIDFGSGYPSDPKTRAFLLDYRNEHEEIKRKSWKTFTTLVS
jgi:ribonuclease HII